jgi:hypothetical protein
MDLAALKAELLAGHPVTGPYSADDAVAADQLNAVNRQPDRETLSGGMIAASVVRSELAGLTAAADRDYVRTLMQAGEMPLTQTLKQELGAIFGAGSQTRANLIALLKRTGSRAEELGLGTVTPSHVADARRL